MRKDKQHYEDKGFRDIIYLNSLSKIRPFLLGTKEKATVDRQGSVLSYSQNELAIVETFE
jgi:hypothetical protein